MPQNVSKLRIPFVLGGKEIFPPVIAAPMAGYTRLGTRILYRTFGAGMNITEMVSSKGLARGEERTMKFLNHHPEEGPVGVQVFGSDPSELARAVQVIEEKTDAVCVDLNMGCPVKKISSGGHGAALMRSPELVYTIVRAMVDASLLPITVKMRSGPDSETINYLEVGKAVQEAGASAIALHPRSKSEKFKGESKWEQIKDLVDHLRIPVIGNGDVRDARSAIKLLELTGCQAIMIGRGAIGNPWIFEILSRLAGGENWDFDRPCTRSLEEIIEVAHRHYSLDLHHSKYPKTEYLKARKLLPEYLAGFGEYTRFREGVLAASSNEELVNFLESFQGSLNL